MKRVFYIFALFFCILSLSGKETLVAHWDFSKGIDSLCGKYKMNLRANCSVVKDAKNGSFLRIHSDGKKAAGLVTRNRYKELTPSGGFRVEITFRPAAGKNSYQYLVDSKYVTYFHKNPQLNKGFIINLVRVSKRTDLYYAQAHLGFGTRSISLRDNNRILKAGSVYTLAFSWDGHSMGRFFWDGKCSKELYVKNGAPVAQANYPLSIGDRLYSTQNPFNGDIFSVKLFSFPAREKGLMLRADRRRVFLRNEKDAKLQLTLQNDSNFTLNEPTLQGVMNKKTIPVRKLSPIAPGKTVTIPVPVESRLTPGWRDCSFTVSYVCNGKKRKETLSFPYGIAPLTGDRMPVVIWGFSLPHKIFRDYGFTHGLKYVYMGNFTREHANRMDTVVEHYRELDQMLMDSFRGVGSFHVDLFNKQYPRITPDGKPYKNNQNFDAAHPEGQAKVKRIASEAAKAFSDHIGMDGLLINSEVRDRSKPSFGKHNLEQWKKHSSTNAFPEGVRGRTGPHWSTLADFPLSRIIPDHDILLKYYKWFWHSGDGWNVVHTLIHNEFKKEMRSKDFWTFYDPAVRVPPLWGSGGKVDYLSHWTYTYPDPINIMANTAEMFAMQKGVPGQGVMNMTQIICYRSQTAPVGKKVEKTPDWVRKFPKAPYISLSPDMLTEALWAQITRKVEAIMFHGYNSLMTDPRTLGDTGYQCTNPHTKKAMKKFLHTVIRPLGPVLKRIPERPAKVAVLESFASHVYAGRGSMGWSGWVFDLNVALHWANIQYKVMYEEEVAKYGLDQIDVLVMPHCDVLPESVYKKILAFQKRGGILVADEFLTPALLPDVSLNVVRRNRFKPEESKKALQKAVMDLRKKIAPYHTPYTQSSNPDLVTYVRSDKKADYLFVINDKRVFGDYFGPYGMVMEDGTHNQGVVRVRRKDVKGVYDLVRNQAVPFRQNGAYCEIKVNFSTNDGRLFLLLDDRIHSVQASLSEKSVSRGACVVLNAALKGMKKKVTTLHPLQITVKNSAGIVTDDSTYTVLENGACTRKIHIPLDAAKGTWRVTVKELASGKSQTLSFTVR